MWPRSRDSRYLLAALLAALALARAGPEAVAAENARDGSAGNDRAAIIIYSHGTVRPQRVENCDAAYNRVPPSVLRLEKIGAAKIDFLCSTATDGNEPGSYIYKRAREIGKEVARLLAGGVKSSRIFLAGHSAGAWSSLMYMRNSSEKINAAILFAPACCGRRFEITKYPVWRRTIRPRQVAEIAAARKINALVFAYTDDPFNRPEELEFLTKAFPKSVEIVSGSCGKGHLTHLNDCRLRQTTETIEKYLARRLSSLE